jgi:3-oxoacyl-[acyl-carrier protein] reductase
MKDLKGKVAIVTGSSKGIGAAIAERLASDGASVVVNYSRAAAPAEALVQRITSGGGKAIAVQADLSKSSEIAKLFSEASKAFGRLDILVNNAGIYKFLPLEAVDEEHIDKHFNKREGSPARHQGGCSPLRTGRRSRHQYKLRCRAHPCAGQLCL